MRSRIGNGHCLVEEYAYDWYFFNPMRGTGMLIRDNLQQILATLGQRAAASVLDAAFIEEAPTLTQTIVLGWPSYVKMYRWRLDTFATMDGCIIIPYGKGRSALLPATREFSVRIIDVDCLQSLDAIKPVTGDIPLMQKAATLAGALFDWAKAGFAVATEEQQAQRKALCQPCEFWKGDGYAGMGECKKCGCSGVKLKLATSKCPIGKWDAVNNS